MEASEIKTFHALDRHNDMTAVMLLYVMTRDTMPDYVNA